MVAAVAVAATAVSAVVGAVGSYEQGQAQKQAYDYQAQVARNNAKIAQQNASWATQIGDTQAVNEGMKTRAQVGAIKAAQAASGIDVNTGSAVDVRSSASELGELNALTIRSNAARQAYGYQVQGTSDIAQAQLDVYSGNQAQTAGYIGAFGSLLGGASSAGGQYIKFQQAGLLS